MGVMGSFTLDVETDGDVSGSPYGTITFEDVGAGEVAFTIDLEGILDGADIHQFGFQADYSGPLAIDPTSIGAADFTVIEGASVAGVGSLAWDYVVDFDNGTPVLEPLQFTLSSVDDAGFDAADLFNGSPLTVKGFETSVAVHAQRTDTQAGSETVIATGGPGPISNVIPEPATAAAFGLLMIGAVLTRRRKRK